MNIKEFAESRGIEQQTVARYIARHPEFSGHAKKDGKRVVLDDYAIHLLDAKYPAQVQVLDPHLKDELLTAYKTISELQNQILQLKSLEIETAKQQALLDVSNRQIAQLQADSDRLQADLDKSRADAINAKELAEKADQMAADANSRADQAEVRAKAAEEELDQMKHRSFWQRLLNK